jgi:hypothetical protein
MHGTSVNKMTNPSSKITKIVVGISYLSTPVLYAKMNQLFAYRVK